MTKQHIDIWYGDRQTVGASGFPQRWFNVLGRVHRADEIVSLHAQLNQRDPQELSIGPDRRRLIAKGDFNVDLDIDDLKTGENELRIEARFSDGTAEERVVEVVRPSPQPPALPLEINWEREGIPNRYAQVVDGLWEVNGRYVSTREIGYDRLIAIGDMSWRDYEVLVPVVVHGMEARAYTWPSVHTGVGVVMRWQGHTDRGADEHASGQPRFGPTPYGAIGWWTTWADRGQHLNFFDVDLKPRNPAPRILSLNTPYLFRVRVTTDDGASNYALRVWREGTEEPTVWDVEHQAPSHALESGGLLLGAHETATSYGPVRITAPVR